MKIYKQLIYPKLARVFQHEASPNGGRLLSADRQACVINQPVSDRIMKERLFRSETGSSIRHESASLNSRARRNNQD
jgi:hypothetical protein